MFEHMKIGKFVFRVRALDDLHLPAYKGATLRGGFGQALKRVTCALRNQECGSCLLRERCVYLYLFETPPGSDAEMMRLYPAAPHPFVIEPPETEARSFGAGGTLDFGLVIIGKAVDHLPYFVYAFTCLGEQGLGSRRGKFRLEAVLASSAQGPVPVYNHESQVLKGALPYPTWDAVLKRCDELAGADRIRMTFCTPIRIKFNGRFVEDPQFHHLTRSLLRRVSSLSYFHCGRKLELDFRGLIAKAERIERTDCNLSWYDWDRYSSRQKQRMSLGGFVGSATFRGEFRDFLPLLALGEVIHAGKAAGFGLGRYEIHIESKDANL